MLPWRISNSVRGIWVLHWLQMLVEMVTEPLFRGTPPSPPGFSWCRRACGTTELLSSASSLEMTPLPGMGSALVRCCSVPVPAAETGRLRAEPCLTWEIGPETSRAPSPVTLSREAGLEDLQSSLPTSKVL